MVLQAQAGRPVALAMTVPPATYVPLVTTALPVDRAPRAMTGRPVMTAVHDLLVMTAHHARIVRIAPHVTNMPSAMVAPFAKGVTLTPRASSTVPFVRHVMNDVTSAHLVMTVLFATTVRPVTTASLVDRAPRATTVHRARIAPIVRSAPLVMTARHATTVAQPVMTADLETIVSLVMNVPLVMTVPPAATPTSILRATRRRSTSPAKTSYSSVFRRWPQRPMMSMA
jgi:hypothetical protein